MLPALALAACALLWPVAGPAAAGEPAMTALPPEPEDYRFEPYRTPTPATLAGAEVLAPEAAAALWREGAAVFIDVLPRPPRPAGLPAGTVWRELRHESIPGAHWLPNVGFGALDEATATYFAHGLAALTKGNPQARIVIFCLKDCWMSWNAAKRALALGYVRVAWFPEGVDGWTAAGLPLEPATPWRL
ncbi:PQQ-dependent catabolism-associated CXXCW motif protein [Xanthobacter sp. AM11]|uniref:PQQ-dependent catabolism-associated CXXCW motif protein n=1 Tax=Xanthobacter sp. AM11 TaxID=3380643 RepID=UPI0039BFF783